MVSVKEYEKEQKNAEKLIKTRNKACALISDAQARYVKEKTRARSKKAAMEKDALLNSPRYKCLNIYNKKEEIQDDYGYDAITESERDRLEELWDEREEVRHKKDDAGFYKDEVTEALNEAYVHIADIWESEIEKSRAKIKEFEDFRKAEVERGEEYERLIEKQYNEFVKAKE